MTGFFNKNRFLIICELLSFIFLISGIATYILCGREILNIALIRNFLPDFLWMMSFMFALTPLLKEVFLKHYIIVSAAICFSLSFLFELFQFLGIVSGTGDILDLAVYFAADVISCITIKFLCKE